MLRYFLIISTFISLTVHSQTIELAFDQIKTIPCNYYPKEFPKETYNVVNPDSSFKYIVDRDMAAIPWLIEKIDDTAFTSIKKPGEESFLRKGDLATILIDHIRLIPWDKITSEQFDICCSCGALPFDVFSYLEEHRREFQTNYRKYYRASKSSY